MATKSKIPPKPKVVDIPAKIIKAEVVEFPVSNMGDFAIEPPANKIGGVPPMEYKIVSKTGVPCVDWLPQTIGDSIISMGGQQVEFALCHPMDFVVYSPTGVRLEKL